MPYPWSVATLVYTVTAKNATPAALASAMDKANNNLYGGELDLIGATVLTDDTIATLTGAQRTIVLSLDLQFNASLQPNADPKAMFVDLYKIELEKILIAPVVAAPPVVT